MDVTLTQDAEELVKLGIESGAFESPNDAVEVALRLLFDNGKYYSARRAELRDELRRASAQIEQGDYSEYKSGEDLAASVISRARQLRLDKASVDR